METRDVTQEEFNEFWDLFHARHPDIDNRLPSTRILLKGSIFCNQPATMPDDEYEVYFRFLRRWYVNKGIISFKPDLMKVRINDTTKQEINADTIKDIRKFDNTHCHIYFNDTSMTEMVVMEDFDSLIKRWKIF